MDSRRKRQVLETPKIDILKYHPILKLSQNKNMNQTGHFLFLFAVVSLIIARIIIKCSNRIPPSLLKW